jgi:hypothetical protein
MYNFIFYDSIHTGHTQKNGAVSIVNSFETAPFFCVCPVYFIEDGPTCFEPYMRFIFRDICFLNYISPSSKVHVTYFNINFSNQDDKDNILNCIT